MPTASTRLPNPGHLQSRTCQVKVPSAPGTLNQPLKCPPEALSPLRWPVSTIETRRRFASAQDSSAKLCIKYQTEHQALALGQLTVVRLVYITLPLNLVLFAFAGRIAIGVQKELHRQPKHPQSLQKLLRSLCHRLGFNTIVRSLPLSGLCATLNTSYHSRIQKLPAFPSFSSFPRSNSCNYSLFFFVSATSNHRIAQR